MFYSRNYALCTSYYIIYKIYLILYTYYIIQTLCCILHSLVFYGIILVPQSKLIYANSGVVTPGKKPNVVIIHCLVILCCGERRNVAYLWATQQLQCQTSLDPMIIILSRN